MHERPPPVRDYTIWRPHDGYVRFRVRAAVDDEWYAQGVIDNWPHYPATVKLAFCGAGFELGAGSMREAYGHAASFVRLAVHLYQRGIVPPYAWLQAYDNIGAWPRWSMLDAAGFYEDSARRARRRQGFQTAHRLAARS